MKIHTSKEEKSSKKQKTFDGEFDIPEYQLGKRKSRNGRKARALKRIGIIVLIFALVAGLFYLPPLYFKEADRVRLPSEVIAGDDTMLQVSISYMRNNPDLDFDGDGLTNEQELEYNTNVYGIDNDRDGVTDYAELYITETNPCLYDDGIIEYVKSLGGAANDPFKIHNVVMWADDYESKAKGSVVLLQDGYRFSNFSGWVQFPEGKYAYKVENGYQTALKSNGNGQFYIDCKNSLETVRVYNSELPMTYLVHVFGNVFYMEDNWIGKALSFILPSYGTAPITCRKVAIADGDGTNEEIATANPITTINLEELSESRFGMNQNSLTDLSYVYEEINKGNNVVASLYSHTTGEVLVEIYGYTNRDNLLIADPETGEELGYLNITVQSSRLLDNSESIQQYEWFSFEGCGYSSELKHRISFPLSVKAE